MKPFLVLLTLVRIPTLDRAQGDAARRCVDAIEAPMMRAGGWAPFTRQRSRDRLPVGGPWSSYSSGHAGIDVGAIHDAKRIPGHALPHSATYAP